jgi:hypothetical protein
MLLLLHNPRCRVLFRLTTLYTQRQLRKGRANTLLKMMMQLRNKKEKRDLITLHKGSFHPSPAQSQQKLHQLEPQSQKEEGYFSPHQSVVVEARVRRPFTRSSTKKESVENEDIVEAPIKRKGKGKTEVVENHIEVIDITTPPENPTFKRLNKQLKEARKEIANLKGEGLDERKNLKDLMDMYQKLLINPGL